MADTLVAALEEAFQEARGRDIALADQLAFIARRVHELSPQFSGEVDNFVRRLQAASAGAQAPQIGEPMPGFILPDDEGRLVSLDRLLETAPVAIAFLRGHWCPYCRLHAAALAKVKVSGNFVVTNLATMPVALIGIAPPGASMFLSACMNGKRRIQDDRYSLSSSFPSSDASPSSCWQTPSWTSFSCSPIPSSRMLRHRYVPLLLACRRAEAWPHASWLCHCHSNCTLNPEMMLDKHSVKSTILFKVDRLTL